MKVVFCLSYLAIPLVVSNLSGEDDYRIVTHHPQLEKFLAATFDPDKIINSGPPLGVSTNPVILFKKYLQVRKQIRELKSKLEVLGDLEIYFSFNSFGFHELAVIKQLSESHTVHYIPDSKINYPLSNIFRDKVICLIYRIFCGVKYEPTKSGRKLYPAIAKSELKPYHITTLDPDFNYSWIIDRIEKKSVFRVAPAMFLTGSVVSEGIVGEKEYIEKTDIILRCLGGIGACAKKHPRFVDVFSLERELPQIPDYIPASIILESVKLVVGYGSSVLFEAARMNIKSISTIYLYEPKDPARRDELRNYLSINSDNKVLFPKSIDELKEILDN